MAHVLERVETRLRSALGEPEARAAVTFVGADRIEVLRFATPDGDGDFAAPDDGDGAHRTGHRGSAGSGAGDAVVRYATLGMSAQPMTGAQADPAGGVVAVHPERGPRAELLLTLRAGRVDTGAVLRPLAVFAASPQVEGVVVEPGGSLDTGEPLWPGACFTSVLVAEPGGLVPDLELDPPLEAVRFLPVLPMTPEEAAWKRVHGSAALQELWLRRGTDLRDPLRRPVPLPG